MNTIHHWLTAIHLKVTPHTFLQWLASFSNNIEALFSATTEECMKHQINVDIQKQLTLVDNQAIEKALKWAEHPNHHLINITDPAYPVLLKEIHDPPLLLFVKGNPAVLSQLQLAMVGSRSPSHQGLKNAEQFARCLAEMGFTVTSGLASGIDGASHRGALAAGGHTIAVCGTGLAHCYPRHHEKLAEDIAAHEGAVISEFPLDAMAIPFHFPRRNRIISGLSRGVLVIEAALKSGSLITAKHALENGREVFAIPGNIHNPTARGCHLLIRQGAKLVESAEDILEEFAHLNLQPKKLTDSNASPIAQPNAANSLAQSEPTCQQLLGHIEYEITPLDVIVWRAGLTASEVSSMLLVLELKGYIECVPGGYIRVKTA